MSEPTDPQPPAFSFERFAERVGERFEIGEGEHCVTATLIEARDLREAQGIGQRSRQFSLIWRGPPGALLAQRIYSVRHPQLGAMDLFLVCIGNEAEGARYEAVFT